MTKKMLLAQAVVLTLMLSNGVVSAGEHTCNLHCKAVENLEYKLAVQDTITQNLENRLNCEKDRLANCRANEQGDPCYKCCCAPCCIDKIAKPCKEPSKCCQPKCCKPKCCPEPKCSKPKCCKPKCNTGNGRDINYEKDYTGDRSNS